MIDFKTKFKLLDAFLINFAVRFSFTKGNSKILSVPSFALNRIHIIIHLVFFLQPHILLYASPLCPLVNNIYQKLGVGGQ